MHGRVSIVIVNWNSGNQLRECVQSINEFHCGIVSDVIIVDNASIDGSEQLPHSELSVRSIPAGKNLGFGKACNLGARHAKAEFILFLNPDAALYADTLSHAVGAMQQPANRQVGICGVQLVDAGGHIARSCSRFPSITAFLVEALGLNRIRAFRSRSRAMTEWEHDDSRLVDQVIGAFFLIRRSLFEQLDGFDERFFVYFEEVDLAYRAALGGWRSLYLADTRAYHAGGGTSGQVKAARLFYSLRSRLQYGFKHFSPLHALLLATITLVLEPISRSVFSLLRGGIVDVGNTVRGYAMLWHAMPSLLRTERR